MKINSLSEFKITESSSVIDESTPFKFSYYTLQSAPYVASWDGEVYTNCRRQDDGTLLVIFENHNLNVGDLWVRRDYFIEDSDFADGIRNISSTERCPIELTMRSGDATQADIDYVMPYAKGASAYDVAVEEGFVGSKEEWLNSLVQTTPVIEDFYSEENFLTPNTIHIHREFEKIGYAEVYIIILEKLEDNPTDEYIMIFTVTMEFDGFYDFSDRNITWVGCVDSLGKPQIEFGKTYEINIVGSRGIIVEW